MLQAAYVASMKASGRALERHGLDNPGHPAIEDADQRGTRPDATPR